MHESVDDPPHLRPPRDAGSLQDLDRDEKAEETFAFVLVDPLHSNSLVNNKSNT